MGDRPSAGRRVTIIRHNDPLGPVPQKIWPGEVLPMVERVARTICAENIKTEDVYEENYATLIESTWSDWIPCARAVIAAMREPTLYMIVACGDLPGSIQHDWPRLIDAALSDPIS